MLMAIPGAIHSMFLSMDLILVTPLAIHIVIGFYEMPMRKASYLSTGDYCTQRKFTIRNDKRMRLV